MPLFLLAFLLVGAEIWTLITVGARLGAGTTLLLLLIAAIAGGMLIRREGFTAARRLNAAAAAGEPLAAQMVGSLARLLAGLLMIFPGFLTDALALALLIPAVRRWMVSAWLPGLGATPARSREPGPQGAPADRPGAGRVIEGQSNRIKD